MMLACPSSLESAPFHLVESIVWSIALLAPIGTFLFLPRLLPLRRELAWSRVKALWPLGWLASRGDGGWRARLREAWLADVRAEHPEGTKRGEVVRDPTLLLRARAVGWTVGALLLTAHFATAALIFAAGDPYSGRLALALALTGLATGWLGRIAGAGAGLWAQSLALGRGAVARLGAGLLVGGGYGAIAGFTAAFAGLFVLVPAMTLLTWDGIPSRDMMIALTLGGVFSAFVGALFGAVLLAPIALAAKRK